MGRVGGAQGIDNLLAAALTGLSKRQEVISNNISNIDTPRFKAARVGFEAKLRSAMMSENHQAEVRLVRTDAAHLSLLGSQSESLEPKVSAASNTSQRDDGNNVDIDTEMTNLAETNIRYNALARLVSSRLALLKSVASGGR